MIQCDGIFVQQGGINTDEIFPIDVYLWPTHSSIPPQNINVSFLQYIDGSIAEKFYTFENLPRSATIASNTPICVWLNSYSSGDTIEISGAVGDKIGARNVAFAIVNASGTETPGSTIYLNVANYS